jgi:hypothetical protein
MKITYLGQAGLLFETKNLKIIVDPYLSDSVENLDKNGDLTYDFKYGREVGTEDVTTKAVPFSSRYIDQSTIDRMARLVPESYALFRDRL